MNRKEKERYEQMDKERKKEEKRDLDKFFEFQ